LNFFLNLESSGDRLEEVARNYQNHGSLTLWQHTAAIDAVTSDSINAAASRVLSGKPTLIVTGGAINLVPTLTEVQRQLA
jgi:predicted Zn-dependent peptidase